MSRAESAEAPAGWRHRLSRIPVEVVILGVLAALTRFVFLNDPHAIVFDEVYFREYALHYKSGVFYFDVHPPLGKLLLAAWAGIAGVDATFADKDPATVMRVLPALAGAALVLVIYAIIRQLSGNRRAATFGAALVLFENALVAESRLILIDSMLLVFGFAAISVALAARGRTGRSYWILFATSAALAGCAAATKVIGLSALGMIGLLWLFDVVRQRPAWKVRAGQFAVLALVPFTVYALTFAFHFAFLTKSSKTFDAYMSAEYQSTLKGNPQYRADAHMSFPERFIDLNRTMQNAQNSLNNGTHPYRSKWTSWPVMKRGVYLYLQPGKDGKSRYIYTLGNPIVWWGVLLGAAAILIGWIARPARFRAVKWPLIFLGVGWMANYLPFAFIERPMFLYHYFYALVFSIAFVAVGLGALLKWNDEGERPFRFATRASALGYWGLLGAVLFGFLYFSPITYGLPLTPDGLDARMWLHSWR
jgi:dolichyl-phosphate-mannose-protein mannosyltransferase